MASAQNDFTASKNIQYRQFTRILFWVALLHAVALFLLWQILA